MSPTPQKITVETTVNAPIEKVWEYFTQPRHVVAWNNASSDWHTTTAENDLRQGGTFNYRMEAKDGSAGFDFGGTYDKVVPNELIAYTIGDGRKVSVTFTKKGGEIHISETFKAESENPIEMQRSGWQNIMDNFKKYTEGK